MPHNHQARVDERSFRVPDYARFLNSMRDNEYRALKNQYNTSSPRRHIKTFEQCCFSLDNELEEYLGINSAAGFRSNPGEADLKRMLEMWLGRDTDGEPDSRVAAQISAHYQSMGFRPYRGDGGSNGHGGSHAQGSQAPSNASASGRRGAPPPFSESGDNTLGGGSQRGSSQRARNKYRAPTVEDDHSE